MVVTAIQNHSKVDDKSSTINEFIANAEPIMNNLLLNWVRKGSNGPMLVIFAVIFWKNQDAKEVNDVRKGLLGIAEVTVAADFSYTYFKYRRKI